MFGGVGVIVLPVRVMFRDRTSAANIMNVINIQNAAALAGDEASPRPVRGWCWWHLPGDPVKVGATAGSLQMSDIPLGAEVCVCPNFGPEIDCPGDDFAYYPRSILSVKKGLFLKVPEIAV